jgi:hypothetical protein
MRRTGRSRDTLTSVTYESLTFVVDCIADISQSQAVSDIEDARARLRRWVAEQESRAAAARAIGCHSSYLTHLLADGATRRPGLEVAFAIQAATEAWVSGPIKADDWLGDELQATGS